MLQFEPHASQTPSGVIAPSHMNSVIGGAKPATTEPRADRPWGLPACITHTLRAHGTACRAALPKPQFARVKASKTRSSSGTPMLQ
jgi:hypothetical protein